MPVMQIGKMGVPMRERLMSVPMAVRLACRIVRPVFVLMMLVMRMPVFMLQRLVRMVMVVAFGQMYPQSGRHETARGHQPDR